MRYLWSLLFALAVITAGVAFASNGSLPALAQDQTQTPTPAAAPVAVMTMPASVHEGTCAQPVAEPAYDLGDVKPYLNDDGQPLGQGDQVGTLTTPPLLTTTETAVEANLDDLLTPERPYVVVVHQDEQNFQTLIACGDIGGFEQDGQLVIGLRPLSNSGYAGIATLVRADDTMSSNIVLMSDVGALSGQAAATPAAEPTPTLVPTAPPTPSPSPSPSPTTVATTVVTAVVPANATTTVVATTPTPTPAS